MKLFNSQGLLVVVASPPPPSLRRVHVDPVLGDDRRAGEAVTTAVRTVHAAAARVRALLSRHQAIDIEVSTVPSQVLEYGSTVAPNYTCE